MEIIGNDLYLGYPARDGAVVMESSSDSALDLVFLGDLAPSGAYSQDIGIFRQTLVELRQATPSNAILFFNLECSLFEGATGGDTETNVDALRALAIIRPAVANLANNHHFDSGPAGSKGIRSILDEIGIPAIGLYQPDQPGFDVLNVGSAKIAIVSRLALGTHPKSFGDEIQRILPLDHDELRATCQQLVGNFDLCVACLHWGAEYYLRASPKQVLLVDQLIDLGVDIVWGHHAHVLQGRAGIGKSLVMYNMGNTIFGQTIEGRWPKISSRAALIGFQANGKERVFWERYFVAGIRGQVLNFQPAKIIRQEVKRRNGWQPLRVITWILYRVYMEVFVFGGRFLARRLQRRPVAVMTNQTIAQPRSAGGFGAVIHERLRRVVTIWEDE